MGLKKAIATAGLAAALGAAGAAGCCDYHMYCPEGDGDKPKSCADVIEQHIDFSSGPHVVMSCRDQNGRVQLYYLHESCSGSCWETARYRRMR